MEPLVELRNVTFGYNDVPVLTDINIHLHRGQFAALVGPSGAGKTSLLKLVLGTQKPNHGSVLVGGRALAGEPAPYVSYVPQVDTIDWNFPVTVEQVVLMGRVRRTWLWPWPSRVDREQAYAVMERLQVAHLAQNHIRNLSGGQQQRVFLARALIAQPDLLVLDEPTSGVDMQTAEKMLHLLLDLNRDGMTILMTTHDLNMAAAHVPWAICINGRVIAQGPPVDVFTAETLSATYRGEMEVVRHNGMLLIYQKPHEHSLADVLPNPVPGHVPGDAADIDVPAESNGRADAWGGAPADLDIDQSPEEESEAEGASLARTIPV